DGAVVVEIGASMAIVVDVAGQFQLVTVVDDIVGVDLKNENLRPYRINDLLNEQHFLERAVTGGAIGKNLRRRGTPLHERIVGMIIRDVECRSERVTDFKKFVLVG